MARQVLGVIVLALVVFQAEARADADSLTDGLNPRDISVGEAMRADARGAQSITLNPAGLALNKELVFEGWYGYRPGDHASSAVVAACDSTVPMPGCFYYKYFTADPQIGDQEFSRRVHEFGMVASRALTPRVTIGATGKYFDYNSDLTGEEDASGYSLDLGTTVVASQSINVAVVGYNMLASDSPQYPRGVGAGLSIRPMSQLALGFDGVWNLDTPDGESTGRYGGGAEYFMRTSDMQAGYPLRLGAVYDNHTDGTYLTAGLGFLSMKVGIDLAMRKQVDGGDELQVTASLRLFGPRQADTTATNGW